MEFRYAFPFGNECCTRYTRAVTQPQNARQPVLIVIAAAGFTLAALGFGVPEARCFRTALSSAQWPVVQGRVLSSESGWEGTGKSSRLQMRIRYAFIAEGTNWEGDHVTAGNVMEPYAGEAVPRTYPAGSTVEVHYRPGSPVDSVLEAGPNMTHVVYTSALFSFSGLGMVFLGWQLREWCRRQPPAFSSSRPPIPAGRKRIQSGGSPRTDGK